MPNIEIPGIGPNGESQIVAFPDDMSQEEMTAAVASIDRQARVGRSRQSAVRAALKDKGYSDQEITNLEAAYGPDLAKRVRIHEGLAAAKQEQREWDPSLRAVGAISPTLATLGGLLGFGGGTLIEPGGGSVLGAIGGAAAGGMAGKAIENPLYKMLGYEPDPTLTTRILSGVGVPMPKSGPVRETIDVLAAGPEAGGMEATGLLGIPAIQAAGRGLYGFALGLNKSVRRQMGDVAAPLLARRIPVTKGGLEIVERGARAAQQEVGAAARRTADVAEREWAKTVDKTANLLSQADAAGTEITAEQVAQPMIANMRRRAAASGVAVTPAQEAKAVKAVQKELDRIQREGTYGFRVVPKGVAMKPSAAHAAKQAAQTESKAGYRAIAEGRPAGAPPARTQAVARGLRESLGEEVPGYAEGMAKTRELIGVRRALRAGKVGDEEIQAALNSGDPRLVELAQRRMRSADWTRITPSGEPRIAQVGLEARTAQELQKATERGLRAGPMAPPEFPAPSGSPALDDLISRARESVGMRRAIEDAVMRQRPITSYLLPGIAGGGTFGGMHDPAKALAAAVATHYALSPGVTSRAGIALNELALNPVGRFAIRQTPRLLDELMEQALMNPTRRQGGTP